MVAGLLMLTLAACGSDAPTPTGAPAPTLAPSVIEASDVTPILATTELRAGTQRVAFLLESSSRLVTAPVANIIVSHGGAQTSTAEAMFSRWPYGTRGSYVTEVTFDNAGEWLLEITVDEVDGVVPLAVDVAEKSAIADIGQLAPFSNTKTLETAHGDLSTISSHQRPDPDLYRMTVVEALSSGRPSVIVFASPAFCTSPTCGPEVDTIVELKELHKDEANFIHVEIYDNPNEIAGDLTKARLAPYVAQWGIDETPGYRNESWVFILGRDGRIAHRYQGYATLDELEAALTRELAS